MHLDKWDAALRQYNYLTWLACKHHKTHKNEFLDFKTHPYQRQIYNDKSKYIVIIKSTQNGISEYALVRALSNAIKGLRVFFVFPTFDVAKRFVDERYTKTTQNTPYYRMLVRLVKEDLEIKQTESVKSKDIGEGNIAFVNSGSEVNFTEYPADDVIIDELDMCDQKNIEMAWERLSASKHRLQLKISNPTFKNIGIDLEYSNTDRLEWFVKCPSGHSVSIDWFDHFVRKVDDGKYIIRDPDYKWGSPKDIRPICQKCNKPINRKADGFWGSDYKSDKRGYRLTKLFTGTVTMVELLERFNKGLVNDEVLQRFYNADLGQAYTAKGSKIDREMIEGCIQDYDFGREDGLIIAGIDVGKVYNFVIKKICSDGKLKTLLVDQVHNTDELIRVLKEFNVKVGVIDAMPETRESRKIASHFKMMFLCYYGSSKSDKIDLKSKIITVQRTLAIDAVKEAVLTNTILYPYTILKDKDFLEQMTSSTRVYNADKRASGQVGAYEWVEGNKPDHYLHATAYCLIARRLIVLMKR